VLFDLDGTLLDTTDLIVDSLSYALNDHIGRKLPRQEILDLIGRPLIEQMRSYADEADVTRLSERCLHYYEANRDQEVLFPGALEVLDLCRARGLSTALVTSKNRREILGVLDKLPLAERIDTYICSEDTEKPKPFPDPVNLARARLEAAAEDTLFIGDSVYDLRCGKAADVMTGAALWGPNTEATLKPEEPTFLLPSLQYLADLIDRLTRAESGEACAVAS
jgi:pyrophosphatase PpaX